jgi:hypothetical protein
MVALAMIAEACATRQDQSQEVGSVADYMVQGQNDAYAYGYGPYDPYMIGYDPYWARWYRAPVYYYSRGDGDNDCDDGNCGSGNSGHGGHHKPPTGTGTGTTPPRTASHSMPFVGIPHVFSAPAVASGPPGGSGNGGGFGRGHTFSRSGFGGGRGGFGRR